MRLFLIFLILFFHISDATLAAADAPIDLTELTHEEQQQFFACRQRGMMDPPCEIWTSLGTQMGLS